MPRKSLYVSARLCLLVIVLTLCHNVNITIIICYISVSITKSLKKETKLRQWSFSCQLQLNRLRRHSFSSLTNNLLLMRMEALFLKNAVRFHKTDLNRPFDHSCGFLWCWWTGRENILFSSESTSYFHMLGKTLQKMQCITARTGREEAVMSYRLS